MKNRRTKDFNDAFHRLPKRIQTKARRAFHHFRTNPNHPGLQFKLIDRESETYSVRIDDDYRTLAARDGDTWVWFWIGDHKEYDELLSHL